MVAPLAGDGIHRNRVELANHRRVRETVVENALPVGDLGRIVETREHHLSGDLGEEPVATRHSSEQDVESKVLHECLRPGRRVEREVKIAVTEQQADLHAPISARTCL